MIANHPDKFGFEGVVSVSIETTLYHNGRIIAQPDVTFGLKNGEIHILEYKGVGNGELLEKARKQLENAKWWYGYHRQDILPEKIHTHILARDDPKYIDLLRGK